MKVTVKVTGDKAILGAIGLFDVVGRQKLAKAVDRASAAILAGAEQRVPRKSGELAKTLRRKVSRSGMSAAIMAGYGELARKGKAAGARARGLKVNEGRGVYAPVIEFGSQKSAAEPFLFPALEAEKGAFLGECAEAMHQTVEQAR